MDLRPYQINDYKAIEEAFKQTDKVLYQLSTGGGKTVVISQIVCDVLEQEKKFLILVHKEKLLRQMVSTLKSCGLFVGYIIRDEHVNLNAMVIVASVSTVMKQGRIDLIKDRIFDYIVIDEAHHSVTDSFAKVIEAANHGSPCKLLGVTATPYRTDNKNLKDVFEQLIVSSSPMRQLIKDGYLSPYQIFATPVKELQQKVGKSGSDYKMSDLSKYMREPEMIQFLVQSYENFALSRKMICFCVDVSHAKEVMKAYNQAGHLKTSYIDANTKPRERESIFDSFQNGDLEIIFCIETLTEGVDLPECTAVQLARPTLSLILYLQMVGRGLRPKPDGGNCVIIDNSGLTHAFGVPDSNRNWQLDSDLDPNTKSDKILVARRKDGKLTDDIENEEYSELLEMDWDEFMSQSMMSEDEAKEYNQNLKESKLKTLEEIGQFIIKESKLSNLVFKQSYSDQDFFINVLGEYYMSISFEFNRFDSQQCFKVNFNSNNGTDKSISKTFQHAEFNFVIMKVVKDNFTKINKAFEFVKEQTKKEIDLRALRTLIGEKKHVLIKNLLNTEIQKGISEFKFEVEDRVYASGLKSKFDGKIIRIKFLKPSISKTCFVEITSLRGWQDSIVEVYENKYIETENILKVFEKYFEKINNLVS